MTAQRMCELLDELSRCYAMLAVIARRKGHSLPGDMAECDKYWARIATAQNELSAAARAYREEGRKP